MKTGLRDDEMEKIRAALEAVPAVEKAVLFGSRAMGLARSNSDVDILLYGRALTTQDVLRAASLLDETTLPYQFDLIRHDANNASLLEHVREHGKVIFQRQEMVARSKPIRKKSGMASEWTIATIDEVSDKVAMGPFGSSIKVNTFVHDGIPIISGQHLHGSLVDDRPGFNFISEEHAERLRNANVQRGDVIFTHAGNIGQVAYIPTSSKYDRYVISQRQFYMRCNPKRILPEFVVAFFKSPDGRHKLLANTSQTGVPSIARPVSYLRTIEIPIPPIEEQRAIAHILGTLDDKIELNRRMNETLEAMARALFKAWFVDFEPVRAKMTGRWRRGQSLPGLPAHLYDLFPDRLVDSELGEIPEGWKCVQFGVLLESTVGGDWGKETPDEDNNRAVSIIRGTDFPAISLGDIGKVPTRYTTGKKCVARLLQKGDIIIEISGGSPTQPTGRSIAISKSILSRFRNPVVCASFCRRFRPKTLNLGTFINFHLQRLYNIGGTWKYQNQSTGIANFQTTRFLESEIVVLPSENLLGSFAMQAQALLEKISSNESISLVMIRDALLQKLISGELCVADAKRIGVIA